jgi:glyoxylase-like metal-dependent hydrolase (beta-lactamase superfamily II)
LNSGYPAWRADGEGQSFGGSVRIGRKDQHMTSNLTRRAFASSALGAPFLLPAAHSSAAERDGTTVVHRFDQAQPFRVNAYIVEGDDGLVIVDGTLTVSSSAELRRRADSLGKPIKAMLLTHPHPDHYAGIGNVVGSSDVPIVALAGVDDVVRSDDREKNALIGPMFGEEWPKQRVFPNRRVADGTRLDFGRGLAFQAIDIGPAESLHDSLFVLEGGAPAAFIGDLIYGLMHVYTADGRNDDWRKAIERLQSELPEDMILFLGHGTPATTALFAWQRVYLDKFEAAVRGADWRDPAVATEAVVTAMKDYLPNESLLFLMQLSIEPTARRLGLL